MDGQQLTASSIEDDPINRARSVAEKLRSSRARIEAAREMPPDVLSALHDARLFRILLPRHLGGDAIDLVNLAKVTEIVAAADASAGWCIGQGGGCAMTAAYLQSEAATRLFGAPDAVLAWGAGIQGTAVAVPGGYRVTGTWTFASGSRHATILGGHSRIMEADGTPRLRPDGRHADLTALFPRGEARIHDVWQVMGLKGTGSDSFEVADLFVPADHAVDRENTAVAWKHGTIYRFSSTMAYAAAFAGVMLGIARGTLDDLCALAMTKTPRGAASSMRASEVFQRDLAVLEARHRAARAYLHQTLAENWQAMEAGEPLTMDRRIASRLATTHAINEGVDIVAHAYRAAGQTAIFEANLFEQRLRDAHSASQQVQGRQTHYVTVGRHFLDLPPDTTMFI
jgi:alkylation response protein AidB-like acyl-CoA dehydrogenase